MLESFSTEFIENILDHLPVEISFVDADDTARYYSHGDNRIFRRTPAVIGRKVQNCHPSKSVNKVQQILDDFRSGKRDMAQFWINLQEKLVLIRYFAVRDTDKKYLGTLEVTQDITEIKKIEGEKRLLE
jgi:PAS domain S-box-containing protein